MQLTHVVLREIPGSGGLVYPPGGLVDAAEWRNLDALVNQRYLRPVRVEDHAEKRKPARMRKPKGPKVLKSKPQEAEA